jgi:ribose transport system substrate-binding protein
MMRQIGGGSWRWHRLLTLLVLAAIAALALSACGSSKPGGSETSGSAESTETESPEGTESSESTEGEEGESETTAATTGECGEKPETPIEDPEGVVASLPKSTQELYSGYPGPIRKSPWANFKGTPGPWKIGLSNLAVNSAFETNLINGLEKAFDQAKEEGLVTGSLEKAILPDESTETPAQQIAGFQAMVRNGVQGVIMTPLSGEAIAPAITAAGKEGVPTVILGNTSPSNYAIADNPLNIAGGTAATIKAMGGKGDVLIVRGLAGAPAETYGYKQIKAEVEACPEMHIIGEVNGNWNNATAKTAVQQFLASHPEEIDGVLQNGIMGQGVIQAFEQVGRPVPPVSMVGGQAGDLAYFAEHLPEGYNTGGSAYNGEQQAYAAMRVLLNTLGGKEPLVTDIPIEATVVTNKNVKEFVPPGAELNTIGDPLGNVKTFSPQSYLNQFFKQKGGVSGL